LDFEDLSASEVDTRANDEAFLTTIAVVVNGDDVARRNITANGERCKFLVDGHGGDDGGRDMEEKRWVWKNTRWEN
jgi:hypothetical protein